MEKAEMKESPLLEVEPKEENLTSSQVSETTEIKQFQEAPLPEPPTDQAMAKAEKEVSGAFPILGLEQVESLVRKVVEEKIASLFPKPKEPPKSVVDAHEPTPEELLRLGYGSVSPHH